VTVQSKIERVRELAAMCERDALETLASDDAHYWYQGQKYPSGEKIDWALNQLERAAKLHAVANQEQSA
jgi:hypothetical protein